MATQLYARPQNFNFSPNIIPPSPGDLEEARIRRAVDLAKLRELTLAPNFEQQRLDLAKQGQTAEQQYRTGVLSENVSHNVAEEKHWADLLGLDRDRLTETARATNLNAGVTAAHNVAEEKHWANLLGLEHEKLTETARQHNSALSELTDYHKGVLKNQLAGDFMAHVASLYTGDPVKAKETTSALTPILDKLGLHQVTAGLDLAVQKQQNTIAKRSAAEITSIAREHGATSNLFTKLIEDAKRDPETWNQTQALLPEDLQNRVKPKDYRSGYLIDLLNKQVTP